MSEYGLITGRIVNKVAEIIQKTDNSIHIPNAYQWTNIPATLKTVQNTSPKILDSLQAILLLDYGFSKSTDTNACAKEFVMLQDALRSKGYSHVKLYLLTNNPTLYNLLQGSIQGIQGLYYEHADAFLMQDKVTPPYMLRIISGAFDGYGLKTPEDYKGSNEEERLRKTKENLVNNARQVDAEYFNYGKDTPVRNIDAGDYIDSPYTKETKEKADTAQRRANSRKQKESTRKENRKPRRSKRDSEPQEPDTSNLNISGGHDYAQTETERLREQAAANAPRPEKPRQPNLNGNDNYYAAPKIKTPPASNQTPTHAEYDVPEFTPDVDTSNLRGVAADETPLAVGNLGQDVSYATTDDTAVPTVAELQAMFDQLTNVSDDQLDKKLLSDKGVFAVTSPKGSGGSGFVAQAAEMYAMLNKKVLIIDTDFEKRSQVLYFPNYAAAVADHRGTDNSLARVFSRSPIEKNAVPVTTHIDVVGTSRDVEALTTDYHTFLAKALKSVLHAAVALYDVVLIDIPLDYFGYYLEASEAFDNNIFVLNNKIYDIEDFFTNDIERLVDDNSLIMNNVLRKSSIVLNRFGKGNRDSNGYQISKDKVKSMLLSAGHPYDTISVAGAIPEYADWEDQYLTNVRKIWTNNITLALYRNIFQNI